MSDEKASIEETAQRLRKARLTKGLTQAEVAKRAGISENHYAQIERAEKDTKVSRFKKIIKALDISSAEILDN